MSHSLLLWNLRGNLGAPAKATGLTEAICAEEPDVAVLCDAFHKDGLADGVQDSFEREGYAIQSVYYDEEGYREEYQQGERDGMMVLSRLAVQSSTIERYGVRNGLLVTVVDPDTKRHVVYAAIHGDDRNNNNRVAQIKDTVAVVPEDKPAAIVGDLNDMYPHKMISRLLSSRFYNHLAPFAPKGRPRIITTRLGEMGLGGSLAVLEAAGYRDADPYLSATMPASLPLFQLDHIMVNNRLRVESIRVLKNNPYSDHRAVAARLSTV